MLSKDMILLGLGSSLTFCGAEPQEVLGFAINAVNEIAPVARVSRFYRSPAWPDASDPPFVNAALSLSNATPPENLLAALHGIEAAFGRTRGRRNAPRTLDLDLLAYGQEVRPDGRGNVVILPHPRLALRDFVLAPLCEVAPDWVCPSTGKTPRQMLAALASVTTVPLAA
jgi:2-amino-4-hydroxy-6-hydroxymethyldihydropteridine diphosphokinase